MIYGLTMARRQFCVFLCSFGFMTIVLSACQKATPIQTTPDIGATITTEQKNDAQIKLSENGKTFTYHLTDRFSVFLDDENYPVKDLACTPDGIIGYVSNGSLGGPDHYPIMFEAVSEGTCRLQDHDFHVDIVVNP
jgi:hypothetical protein